VRGWIGRAEGWGIRADAGRRWALVRLAGDFGSSRTGLLDGKRPRGEDWVSTANDVYWMARLLNSFTNHLRWHVASHGGGVSCGYAGYHHYWDPCFEPSYESYWYSSSFWPTVLDIVAYITHQLYDHMDQLDFWWDYITTGNGDLTDGFIQYASQWYPESPGDHPVRRWDITKQADSHTGATASPEVQDRVERGLASMGVIRVVDE
jgi:hypothetical protein